MEWLVFGIMLTTLGIGHELSSIRKALERIVKAMEKKS